MRFMVACWRSNEERGIGVRWGRTRPWTARVWCTLFGVHLMVELARL